MSEPATFLDGRVTLHAGDCLDVLKTLPASSVHAVVTDPPYHLTAITKRFGAKGAKPARKGKTGAYARATAGFMGKQWDGGDIAFRPEVWRECWRVLKPGGWLLAFASSRGFGRMAVAIEEAGFISHPLIAWLHDAPGLDDFLATLSPAQTEAFWAWAQAAGGPLAWAFGSGFPKAHDAAKAIDKHKDGSWEKLADRTYQPGEYIPATDEAAQWAGWAYGAQALKPAIEPIFMGQKPFDRKNGAANLLAHGAGALNIDGCQVGGGETRRTTSGGMGRKANPVYGSFARQDVEELQTTEGRWPANLIHDGSEAVAAGFPETGLSSSGLTTHVGSRVAPANIAFGDRLGANAGGLGDSGSAARFFYSAKADTNDRIGSKHPTVKPVDLMQYLVRLVTPPGGTVLDPFAGTGTTGEAAWREGLSAILIEADETYRTDIAERMRLALSGPDERKREIVKRRGDANPDPGPLFAEGD